MLRKLRRKLLHPELNELEEGGHAKRLFPDSIATDAKQLLATICEHGEFSTVEELAAVTIDPKGIKTTESNTPGEVVDYLLACMDELYLRQKPRTWVERNITDSNRGGVRKIKEEEVPYENLPLHVQRELDKEPPTAQEIHSEEIGTVQESESRMSLSIHGLNTPETLKEFIVINRAKIEHALDEHTKGWTRFDI